MQLRTISGLMLALLLSACGADAPPKAPSPTTLQVVEAPKLVVPPDDEPPVVLPPLPKFGEVAEPTLPMPVKPTPMPKVPIETKPGDKEPAKTGKDPKETNKDSKFIAPKAVLNRSFDSWKADIKSKDPTRREKAMKMMLNFGPEKAYEALPDIISELSKHNKPAPIDLSVRVNGVFTMSAIFFNKKDPDNELVDDAIVVYKMFLKDRQVLLRTRAVQGVVSIGTRAQELINEIIDVAHDPTTGEVRKEGILTLARIAVDADKKVHAKVPAELHKALNDVSGQVRLAALQGLNALASSFDDKDKKLTLEKINAFLKKKDNEPFLQMTAHVCIMNITGKVERVHLDPLVKMLTERDELQRGQALQFIKLLGSKAQGAIDDVLALSVDAPTGPLRKEALATAMILAYDKNGLHPAILPALRNALKDSAPEVRQTALNGLAAAKDGMGKVELKITVASLKTFVNLEKEPLLEIVGHATIMTLTGEINQTHMAPIVDMIKHKDVAVRLEALRTIGLAGKRAKPYALTAVIEAIRDPDLTVSEAAIDTLPSIHAFEAIDLLKKIVADGKHDPLIVEAAQDALPLLVEIHALEKAIKDKTK